MTIQTMSTTQQQGFSLDRLRALLSAKNVVLRHDVDYDPACALEMAKLEYELSVTSTYYVRPDAPEYNITRSDVRRIFEQIADLGHDLAPHVDLQLDRRAKVPGEYARLCVEHDYITLTTVLPMVRRVSFHAPPLASNWTAIAGFEHAMGPEWRGRYVADSRGVFRTDPEERLAAGDIVQLNLHPEWWFWTEEKAGQWRALEAVKP